LAPQPTTAIVTGSGGIDLSHPGLRDPRVPIRILAGGAAAERLRGEPLPGHVAVEALADARPSAAQLVRSLADAGARLILCEGGPHLFGELLAAQLVDELFVTVAPQVAGRDRRLHPERLGLVEGLAFDPSAAPWWRLVSLRRAASHLFLRYRLDRPAAGQGGIS
jgi:riboflavin biosynthesis pyrimidine reductase